MDIHAEDLKGVNDRVAYINSCLTGSFHKKNYIAASYPFSDGNNVVAFANTVGVLQDLWGTQLIGILQHGARTGHLIKKTAFLETHILGDPTYHFTSVNASVYNSLFAKQSTKVKELLADGIRKLENDKKRLANNITDLTKEGISEKELNNELRTLRLYRFQ